MGRRPLRTGAFYCATSQVLVRTLLVPSLRSVAARKSVSLMRTLRASYVAYFASPVPIRGPWSTSSMPTRLRERARTSEPQTSAFSTSARPYVFHAPTATAVPLQRSVRNMGFERHWSRLLPYSSSPSSSSSSSATRSAAGAVSMNVICPFVFFGVFGRLTLKDSPTTSGLMR